MNAVFKLLFLAIISIALPNALAQGTASTSGGSNSAHGQAGGAQASQMMGAGVNAVTGAMYQSAYSSCMASCNVGCGAACTPLQIKAIESFMNAASMLMNAGQSGNTMDALQYGIDGNFNPDDYLSDLGLDGLVPDDVGNGADFNSTADLTDFVNGQIAGLANDGVTYDSNSGLINTPIGEFQAGEQTPAQAAAASGQSPSDLKLGNGQSVNLDDVTGTLAAKAAALASKPSVSGVGVDTAGGGGGAGGTRSGSGSGGSAFGDYLSKMKRGLASKKKAVIAGKSKNYGGEQIGVRVDNIFEMIHRRYQNKRKRNSFIEGVAKK